MPEELFPGNVWAVAKQRAFADRLKRRTDAAPALVSVEGPYAGGRASTECFIEEAYAKKFGARISCHYPLLVSGRDARGRVIAAAGLRPARQGPLFLEQYLGCPIEESVARETGRRVPRDCFAEIGNFTAVNPLTTLCLMSAMARSLRDWKLSAVAVTATGNLRRTFRRLNLPFSELAAAKAAALPGNGEAWGAYYEHDPKVIFGSLEPAAACLANLACAPGPVEAAPAGPFLQTTMEAVQ